MGTLVPSRRSSAILEMRCIMYIDIAVIDGMGSAA
jgi:hypothetical protein